MAPKVIAVDEIGSGADFKAIEYAVNRRGKCCANYSWKRFGRSKGKAGTRYR